MLDKFLEVSYGHTKEATEKAELVQLLTDLPIAQLTKLASGEETLVPTQDWLSRFQGTGLYDDALLLEQASIQTMDKHAQDEIGVRKLLLEQKLAGELPPALEAKKIPKGSDADNDGKTNEPSIVEKKEAAARRSLRDVESATVEHYKARGKKKGTSAGAKGGGKVGLGLGALGGAAGGFAAGLKGKGGKGALARAGLGALAGGAAGAAGGVAYGAGKGRKKGEQVGERFGKAVNVQRRRAIHKAYLRHRMTQFMKAQQAPKSKSKKASVEDVEKIAREFARADFAKMAKEEKHYLSRGTIGLPITMAMKAEKGKRMEAFGKGYMHALKESFKGTGAGGLAGALAGAGAGAVKGSRKGRGRGALVGAGYGALGGAYVGGVAGGLKGHLGEEGTKLLRSVKARSSEKTSAVKEASRPPSTAMLLASLGILGSPFVGAGYAAHKGYTKGKEKGTGEAVARGLVGAGLGGAGTIAGALGGGIGAAALGGMPGRGGRPVRGPHAGRKMNETVKRRGKSTAAKAPRKPRLHRTSLGNIPRKYRSALMAAGMLGGGALGATAAGKLVSLGGKKKEKSEEKTSAAHQMALHKLASGVSYGELNAMERGAIVEAMCKEAGIMSAISKAGPAAWKALKGAGGSVSKAYKGGWRGTDAGFGAAGKAFKEKGKGLVGKAGRWVDKNRGAAAVLGTGAVGTAGLAGYAAG